MEFVRLEIKGLILNGEEYEWQDGPGEKREWI